jgi:hypothetical protein
MESQQKAGISNPKGRDLQCKSYPDPKPNPAQLLTFGSVSDGDDDDDMPNAEEVANKIKSPSKRGMEPQTNNSNPKPNRHPNSNPSPQMARQG